MKTLEFRDGVVNIDQMHPESYSDSSATGAFENLTYLAAFVAQAPIALLYLLDTTGGRIESQVGLEPGSTSAYLALCQETLQRLEHQNGLMLIVEDTLADERLASCESVKACQPVRFLAIAPIINPQGLIIGSLSVIDRVPRELKLKQQEALVAVLRQAITQLNLYKKLTILQAMVSNSQQVEDRLQPSHQDIGDIEVALARSSIVAITDHHGKIYYVNDKLCEISKYSREELHGTTHRLLNSGYHPPDFFKQMWATLASGKVWRGTIQDQAKDGSLYWKDTTIVPILNTEGHPHEYVSICKDITETQRVEVEQDRFFTLSPDLMCVIGLDGYFKRVNPAFEKTLLYSAEELLAKPFLEFVHPEDQGTTLIQWQKLVNETPLPHFENRYCCKDGSYKWLSWNSLVLGEEGVVYAIARDITKTKQAKATLLERSRLSTLEADVGAVLVGQNGTLAERLKGCTEAMVQHLHALGAGIWTVNPDGVGTADSLSLELQASAGQLTPAELFPERISLNHGLIGAIAQIQQPINSPLSTPSQGSTRQTFFSGYPLIVDSRLVGVIALHSHQPFSKVVNGVLGWVANAIAVAIDRVWAREELLSRREALLFQLASQIRNSLELDTILDTAVTEIKSLLDLDGCHFLWYIPEPNPPSLSVTHEARNSNLPSLLGECPLPEFAPLAKTITNLQPLRIADLAKAGNVDPETRSLLVHWGITSGLVLPLKTQTGQLGAIVCSYCEGSRQWSDREVELLQAVVDQLAIAIEHAELFAKTRASALAAQTQAHQLEHALNELRQTQALLIQTDKMSTIGQMVAGIAHEINNPVNFITGNLSHATNYIEDLIELINRYQHHYRNPVPEIQDYIDDIELPFLIEDLPKMLASMQIGADRIQEIVVSLRNFSRQDQAEMRSVNIHEGIDSTLLILRNRMKPYGNRPGITVIKEYGNLPLVECYAGQLNQVFMNIISNAIDALETEREGQLNPEPMIWIHTDILDNHDVVIQIRDNGSGMTPSVVERLFEPFFTTKPVGKGTGLGLSISHQIIVEKHRGILNCHSEGGQGTEFWIQIPLKQNSNHPL